MHSFRSIFYNHALVGILFSLLISGCASTEDVGKLQWEVNSLKSEVRDIKKTSQNIETQLPGQTKQLDKKLKELEEAQSATAKTVSDLLINIQNLTSEFQVLTGRFDEARYFTEKSSAELVEDKNLLTSRLEEQQAALAELEKKLNRLNAEVAAFREEYAKKIEEQKKAEEEKKQKAQASEAAGKGAAQSGEVKDAYMAAYQAFKEGKTKKAREEFTAMLERFPENEYSDNARFWIAESYYAEGSYEDAILAYEELFKKNSSSDKIPGAMLKQGLAFYALKDKKTGQIVLEKLIEKFPDSEQAQLARKKINKAVPQKKKN